MAATSIAGYMRGVSSCFYQFGDLMRAERVAFGCEAWRRWSSNSSRCRRSSHLLFGSLLRDMYKLCFELSHFAFGCRESFGVFDLQCFGLRESRRFSS